MSSSISENIRQLHQALSDYIEATYHIKDPKLVQQRKELLREHGVISQDGFIESTPRYQSGDRFSSVQELAPAVLKLFETLSTNTDNGQQLIYNPPYRHQLDAIKSILVDHKNLMIMTGTGSGKTESFLLPAIGKLMGEASSTPNSFRDHRAVRTMILYPMNALVNDQLGRIRTLLSDTRLKDAFLNVCGRIPTFARYTSRTPYPGVRDSKKDGKRLKQIEEFYVDIETSLSSDDAQEREHAQKIINSLKKKGKWPAKPDLSAWFGGKHSEWVSKSGQFRRAVTLPEDSELITRHEVQANPPDILITNYSMLEYMLLRPIERPIFDKTAAWLKEHPDEKFLLVVDEAHLYRGAAGAEVGLLIRRLRERLEITADRLQVVCATASFENKEYAVRFAEELTGAEHKSFRAVTGHFAFKDRAVAADDSDAEILANIDLDVLYNSLLKEQLREIEPFLAHRKITFERDLGYTLHKALNDYGPLNLLINVTMGKAQPINELAQTVFPGANLKSDQALTVLLSLSNLARLSENSHGLLPSRVHSFFRGLPGLWICMNPNCSAVSDSHKSGFCGKLFGQPRDRCECGSRVFELFTCRSCGSAHARAYTDDIENPKSLWAMDGRQMNLTNSQIRSLYPIDLLLQEPTYSDRVEIANLDTRTGQINPDVSGPFIRQVYLKVNRLSSEALVDADDDENAIGDAGGQFHKCCVCDWEGGATGTAVQDHQTKGDEPFLTLLSKQIHIQPPSDTTATSFAPLRGRKVLVFSDSRQTAAKLAPNLQMYSSRDAVRPLLVWGYQKLLSYPAIERLLCLDDSYFAVLLAANCLNVRLRPELNATDTYYSTNKQIRTAISSGVLDRPSELLELFVELRTDKAPESLLKEIQGALFNRLTGMEPLALGSLIVKSRFLDSIATLPDIPGIATSPQQKMALANYWLLCWRHVGYWLKDMPDSWWKPGERNAKNGVKGHASGNFKSITKLLDAGGKKTFKTRWLPILLATTTEEMRGTYRISGKNISLDFSNNWCRCERCTNVQRPFPGLQRCFNCGNPTLLSLDPETDIVFHARKGYYRSPVTAILGNPCVKPLSLIAAEHTAQLNATQSDEVFSKAEENEMLFQDMDIAWNTTHGTNSAIDILSSTTTMEVGIDIGALSGVALRNMPPGRANYQQRAGRAGRRANAVATVVAFGSVDSHDEHFFSKPKEMISGPVVDPILSLNNPDIVRRHVRAYLLQRYHQDKLPFFQSSIHSASLFSVLGTVGEFLGNSSPLTRTDFEQWLYANEDLLCARILSWIPDQLPENDKVIIAKEAIRDCLKGIDKALAKPNPNENEAQSEETSAFDLIDAPEPIDEEQLGIEKLSDGLLDRLLYRGILPRYAFPTDVATFHVFDENRSTSYRNVTKFAPAQSLPIALSQYAPDKQVWISNKCYTSRALYSPMNGELSQAYSKRKLYFECPVCGFAKTEDFSEERKQQVITCDACGENLPRPEIWLRPPGFAHIIDQPAETSPDGMPDVGYATRAKLYLAFSQKKNWVQVNNHISGLKVREHLLVSNTGGGQDGYIYCTRCGRIENRSNYNGQLANEHAKPFRAEQQVCEGGRTSKIVLGTDFITDVALFSLNLAPLVRLRPGTDTFHIALRTLCEALSKAATQILEIEPNDIVAEYRPALTATESGRNGDQVEIFLYDTLSGGAGFAPQLVDKGHELFERALEIMRFCGEHCDSSCYRCLRTFRNKFEHQLLDRHVGIALCEYLLQKKLLPFSPDRIRTGITVLKEDLECKGGDSISITIGLPGFEKETGDVIVVKSEVGNYCVTLGSPLTPKVSNNLTIDEIIPVNFESIVLDELLVRHNLPSATLKILDDIRRNKPR